MPALNGGKRCHWHGGSSPQARAAAARRLAEQRAGRLLAGLGHVEPVTDPIAALENIAGQAVALADLLRGVVANLEEIRYRGGLGDGTENVRGELQAYMSALGRAESVLAKIVSLDLDARRVRLAEAQTTVVVAALARVLAHRELGLDDERRKLASALLQTELHAHPVIEAVAR
jgi:hypothetical protein